MTLSGDGDPRVRRERAKEYRRDLDARRPWLLWLLVGLAVVAVGAAVVYTVVNGIGS
ncbi:hypothetical protein H4J02_08600 [Protaetiibacter sp. SSC-01]|uniref:hypothetical protein n=1 Tax=Protaetiibacter sp. SSC-01 TaxID=2759943 RepID=UPI00165723F5|nr:hypothetical protein [Protaetiibacter sp. SSC-01]QNO36567.1 hypothetical protein H4J02_08600 [Protaetiibacter sp. SSC-01]